jgi:hypothetical protein
MPLAILKLPTGTLDVFMSSEVARIATSHKLWRGSSTTERQAVGARIVVVLGLIIWFVVWQQGEKEVNASEALSKCTSTDAAVQAPVQT